MEEHKSSSHPVIENVASLLRTGRFSDLTLACQGQDFLVHRAVVCARSPVWAAATERDFKESKTKLIDVEIVDACTLRRVLTYLYTGTYDDMKLTSIDYAPLASNGMQYKSNGEAAGVEARELNENALPLEELVTDLNQAEASDPSLRLEEPIAQPESEDRHIEQMNTVIELADDDHCGCYTPGEDQSESVCNNTKLEANALVYILADYCQIPELKRLAGKKFAAALETVCLKGFSDVCHLVYQDVPSTALELRSCLSNAITSNGKRLVEDCIFMTSALLLPELLRDMFASVVEQHHTMSNERDTAMAASLKAEDVAKEATALGQEDKQRLITQVNNARQCRHCGLENNVFFERESVHYGRSDYTFRCRCRTRY